MNLLFIITGSIAVIKCKQILQSLKNSKVNVNCIITKSASKMISKKIIKKAINGKIYTDNDVKNFKMLHIDLTRKSDLIVVCPATANIISKIYYGLADDLASTSLISTDKQILFMPAMNKEMWNNKINKRNVLFLQKIGIEFVGPDYGFLSCGEVGLGRLKDEKKIVEIILDYLSRTKRFKYKKFLVTAGPTMEHLDPIRYISNMSSGIQGYEIAKQLMLNGGKVKLISGPTNLQSPPNVKLIKVRTSKEMNEAVQNNSNVDVAIFSAAVSDIIPKRISKQKIKKNSLKNITFEKNIDILKNFSKKFKNKFIVGFAAETNNGIKNAKKKLLEKDCDLIVLNILNEKNKVFGSEFNKAIILSKKNIEKLKKMTKINLAKILIEKISNQINNFQ